MKEVWDVVKPTNNEISVANNTIVIEVVNEDEKGLVGDVDWATEIVVAIIVLHKHKNKVKIILLIQLKMKLSFILLTLNIHKCLEQHYKVWQNKQWNMNNVSL